MSILLVQGTCLQIPLADKSVHCIVTSPVYWGLRSYSTGEHKGHELGSEPLHDCLSWARGEEPCGLCYICHMRQVARECWRVLRDDGCMFWNIADSYATNQAGNTTWGDNVGSNKNYQSGAIELAKRNIPASLKPKDKCGIPERTALAFQADGWWWRSDIIWYKPNPMPESVTDRPTKSHEFIHFFVRGNWKTSVIEFSDLPSEIFHFGQHILPDYSNSGRIWPCIRLATSIFDFAQSQNNFSLPPFYSEIWEQGVDGINSQLVSDLPMITRLASICARFLSAKSTAKVFMQELNSIWLNLASGDNLLIGGRMSEGLLPPSIYGNGNTSITINNSGEICKVDFVHGRIISQSPKDCKYYWDAEAVREAHTDANVKNGVYQGSGGINKPDWIPHTQGWNESGLKMSDREYNPAGRNLRDVWTMATQAYPGAHFATYPSELPRRCIKAATSERGACPKCGKPWERVVEHKRIRRDEFTPGDSRYRPARYNGAYENINGKGDAGYAENLTLGWRAACTCEAGEPVPCVVLDPFSGAATTGLVARELNRHYIGLELSAEYLSQSRDRLSLTALDEWSGNGKAHEHDLSELPLFGGLGAGDD